MYDLRNLIAHGKEILEEYRKPIEFKFEPPELGYLVENWTYEILLFESACLPLIAALRKIIMCDHMTTLENKRAWRNGWMVRWPSRMNGPSSERQNRFWA